MYRDKDETLPLRCLLLMVSELKVIGALAKLKCKEKQNYIHGGQKLHTRRKDNCIEDEKLGARQII